MSDADDAVLRLSESLRGAFKEPFGPLHTDAERLVGDLGSPVVAVGDVVTRDLTRAGTRPDLAVIDWITERETLADADQPDVEGYEGRYDIANPAGAITGELLRTVRVGIERDAKTVIVVDGEEDLATLPVLAVAPEGASVVYGQPGEGMVHVRIDNETREQARELLSRMDGDHRKAFDALGIE